MAEFEQAGATERLRRIAILRDMQRRLRHSPAEALGVAPTASATEVRSAFMSLTKQYHPTKFARLDEATMKLANEVFLQLREAYETLKSSAELKKPELRSGARAPAVDISPRRLATNNEATAAARPPSAASSSSVASSPSAAVSSSKPVTTSAASPSAKPVTTSAASSSKPATTATSSSGASGMGRQPLNNNAATRASTGAVGSSPRTPSPGSSAAPSTNRPGAASASSTAAARRPAGSASASISGSASAVGSGRVLQPAKPANPSNPSTISSSSSSSSSADGGPRVRFGTQGGAPNGGESGTKEISREMSKVRDLIVRERWAEARDALQLLLVHRPSDRANLAQLAYVRGREALELGNVTEARRELVRALAIEPTMEPAKAALQEISTPSQRR